MIHNFECTNKVVHSRIYPQLVIISKEQRSELVEECMLLPALNFCSHGLAVTSAAISYFLHGARSLFVLRSIFSTCAIRITAKFCCFRLFNNEQDLFSQWLSLATLSPSLYLIERHTQVHHSNFRQSTPTNSGCCLYLSHTDHFCKTQCPYLSNPNVFRLFFRSLELALFLEHFDHFFCHRSSRSFNGIATATTPLRHLHFLTWIRRILLWKVVGGLDEGCGRLATT